DEQAWPPILPGTAARAVRLLEGPSATARCLETQDREARQTQRKVRHYCRLSRRRRRWEYRRWHVGPLARREGFRYEICRHGSRPWPRHDERRTRSVGDDPV